MYERRLSEALEAAASAGLSAMSIVKSPTAPEALVIERQLFAYFDPDDRVEEVEVAVPRDQDDRGVMWNDLDFALDPGAVTGALDEIAKPAPPTRAAMNELLERLGLKPL